VAALLCLLGPCGALAAQEAARSRTTLIVYADPDANELISLHLIVDSPENDIFSLLSIPINTRAIVTLYGEDGSSQTVYAPIRKAFSQGGQDPFENLRQCVERLLEGASVDQVVGVTSQNIADIIGAVGGARLSVSDLPPLTLFSSGSDTLSFPTDDNNGALALWIKRQLSQKGAVAGYDMDVGSVLASSSPAIIGSQDLETVLLSGDMAAQVTRYSVFTGYAGTDIMQMRRQQSLFISFLCILKQKGASLSINTENLLYYEQGSPLLARLTSYSQARIQTSVVFPNGIDRDFAGEIHWVFDTVWLHDWILESIYGIGSEK
jgi:hypothetical protein